MAYVYQNFVLNQVLTAAQVQSLMDSIRDHVHGISYVSDIPSPQNYIINGHAAVANRGSGVDVIRAAAAGTYVYGGPDMFKGAWTGTACQSGSLIQDDFPNYGSPDNPKYGKCHHFSGISMTGSSALYHRTRIEARTAKQLVNWTKRFSVLCAHNMTGGMYASMFVRKAAAGVNDFSSVTNITSLAITLIGANTQATLSLDVALGDCSNGIELETKFFTNVCTQGIDVWLTDYYLGAAPTPLNPCAEPIEDTIAKCKRYTPVHSFISGEYFTIGAAYAANGAVGIVPFDVEARIAPTGCIINGAIQACLPGGGYSGLPATYYSATSRYAGKFIATSASGLVAGNASMFASSSTTNVIWTGCDLG